MLKRVGVIISFILVLVSVVALSQQQRPKVDYRSDLTRIKDKGELIELIGNVAFHHNGAIITCDTAYKYSDGRFEGVGRVIINSDSTFIYGDRFTYDETSNTAQVFAPIIKTIDKDAILYTRNMVFNTLTNVGSYYGGGTLTQQDKLMESESGDYYTENRDIVLYGDVQMQNDEYILKSDSLSVNLNTEYLTLRAKTEIWSKNGEFLESDNGSYDSREKLYTFIGSAYVMGEEQEMWADSLKYWSERQETELRRNVQITDTTQQLIVFGDYGHYWGVSKKVVMTRMPSVIAFSDNPLDSTFLSADTLLVVPMLSPIAEIKREVEGSPLDSISKTLTSIAETPFDTTGVIGHMRSDSLAGLNRDSLHNDRDSLSHHHGHDHGHHHELEVIDSTDKKALKRRAKELKKEAKLAEKEAKKELKLQQQQKKAEEIGAKVKNVRRADRIKKEKTERGIRGWMTAPISDTTVVDSVVIDTLITDSVNLDSVDLNVVTAPENLPDSSDYILRGFKNVKIWKADIQAVCDTIMSITFDSTLHLIDSSIVWSDNNQITAQSILVYSKNGNIDRAELYNYPIIAQKVRKGDYNQVRGKDIDVYFSNNELDIAYVDGNAQTVFYQVEQEQVVGLFTATSASMEIMFDSSQISRIKWINNISSKLTPIDKVLAGQDVDLEGFRWSEDQRPISKYDISRRVTREPRRSEIEAIEKPSFPITELIEAEKIKYIESGVWSDRNDSLPISIEEIIFNN